MNTSTTFIMRLIGASAPIGPPQIDREFTIYVCGPMAFGMILSRGMTRDVLQFRRMFEPAYTLQAMSNATSKVHVRIQRTIDDMEAVITLGEQTSHHDIAFHRAILHATHNPMTICVGETLLQLFEAALEKSMQTLPEVALKDHKNIYASLKAGDTQGVHDASEVSAKS